MPEVCYLQELSIIIAVAIIITTTAFATATVIATVRTKVVLSELIACCLLSALAIA